MGKHSGPQLGSGGWRTRPIFVSGTFRDMHVERDALASQVFPALQEALLPLRTHLERIDLRVGVETTHLEGEHPKQMLVLQVCLDEVKRSRPFLVILLGDRYGWVPPAERMDQAAQEAGYRTESEGKSVTALEVEFGVWGDPEQQTRSFFYFRKLPYDAMDERSRVEYSDACASRAATLTSQQRVEAAGRWQRLQALKARLREDSVTGERCREYEMGWDPVGKQVTGVDRFVAQVITDLQPALEAEAREHLAKVAAGHVPSELELFVAERARGFVGRQALIDRLVDEAVAPGQAEVRGVCLTGSSGSGKSAVFARLCQELSSKDVWLLSHAAGIGSASGWVDRMLAEWIAELAKNLGIPDPLASEPSGDLRLAEAKKPPLEKVFADLLREASKGTRVVILIDALDRFERTNRGRYLTWLPGVWPASVRFIATTIPGEESQVLEKRADMRVEELPPLDRGEALALANGIYAGYHRAPNKEAVAALLDKITSDGRPSAGIPLWLVSAVEELNLLDREDFLRADREFQGLAQEAQLPALVLAMAKHETPVGLAELLARTLERAESSYGKALTRAFAALLALGRIGWRERDLAVLVPAVVPLLFPEGAPAGWEGWSPLAFAALRRGFRAHWVCQGDDHRWSFHHSQMLAATVRGLAGDPQLLQSLHRAIATHLLGLGADDPLFESELMHHLIESNDQDNAARLYAGELSPGARHAATAALAELVTKGEGQVPNPGISWTVGFHARGLPIVAQATLGTRLVRDLSRALADCCGIDTRIGLLEAARGAILQVARGAAESALDEAVGLNALALVDLYVDHGDLLSARRLCAENAEQMAVQWKDRPCIGLAQLMTASCDRLGEISLKLGEYATAATWHEWQLARNQEMYELAPWSGFRSCVAQSLERIGVLRMRMGNAAAAREPLERSLQHRDVLYRDSLTSESIADLAIAHIWLADYHSATDDVASGIAHLEQAMELLSVATSQFPTHRWVMRVSTMAHERMGMLLQRQGREAEAFRHVQAALQIREELLAKDPSCAEYVRDLTASLCQVASRLTKIGQPADALSHLAVASGHAHSLCADSENLDYLRAQFLVDAQRAEAYSELGDTQQAVILCHEVARTAAGLLNRQSVDPAIGKDVKGILQVAVEISVQAREWTLAKCILDQLVAIERNERNRGLAVMLILCDGNPPLQKREAQIAAALSLLGDASNSAILVVDPWSEATVVELLRKHRNFGIKRRSLTLLRVSPLHRCIPRLDDFDTHIAPRLPPSSRERWRTVCAERAGDILPSELADGSLALPGDLECIAASVEKGHLLGLKLRRVGTIYIAPLDAFPTSSTSLMECLGHFVGNSADILCELRPRQRGSRMPVPARTAEAQGMRLYPAECVPETMLETSFYEGNGAYWVHTDTLLGQSGLDDNECTRLLALGASELTQALAEKADKFRHDFQVYPRFDSHLRDKGERVLEHPNVRFERLLCDLTRKPSLNVDCLNVGR